MGNKTPLISIIIPTYNSGRFVAQAVQSVLKQTYRCYEILVVDDGSTDETKDVLSKFGNCIKYIYQENRGPSAARNVGIKVARGKYVCFLDADDMWVPNKLKVQLAFIERDDGIGLVFSDHEEFDAEGILCRSFLAGKMFRSDIISPVPIKEAFKKLIIEN